MARPRSASEANLYHIVVRGSGRVIIFEDDKDYLYFLNRMWELLDDHSGEVLAYCLMDNHAHILMRIELPQLSDYMQKLNIGYSRYFNARHDRVGHLFQGRFFSEAINSDEQLIATVRYIHRNPVKAGISPTCDFMWSSYRKYLTGPKSSGAEFVLDIFGGIDAFTRFHEEDSRSIDFEGFEGSSTRRPDKEDIPLIAEATLGFTNFHSIGGMPKNQRDYCLRKLREAGLSIRQIERLTGVGRGIILRAK